MKILCCGKWFPQSPKSLEPLLPDDEILTCEVEKVKELGLDADVLIPLMHRLEPELIEGTRARLIHQYGVGLEGVDIPLATSRGIMVCNVPADVSLNADSTAELAIFLILGLVRRVHECFRAFEKGAWGDPLGEVLLGGTALIVGLGRVGTALARKLIGLGMKVQAIRKTPHEQGATELGLSRLGGPGDLLEMASTADLVISTVVLSDQTLGLFNRELFSSMKPTAYVINVSRGPVVNEPDLIEALNTGAIAGAGLDVFCGEPIDSSNPLLSMDNVFATPHVGGVTRQNYEEMGRVIAENIRLFKDGKTPKYCVNLSELSGETGH